MKDIGEKANFHESNPLPEPKLISQANSENSRKRKLAMGPHAEEGELIRRL